MPQLLTLPDPKPHLKDIPSFENSTPEGGHNDWHNGGRIVPAFPIPESGVKIADLRIGVASVGGLF
jgi:hypothetical protein